jgi:hypothetical protein
VEGESVCTVTDPKTHANGLTRTCMHTYQADREKAERDLAQINDNDDDEADAEGQFEDDYDDNDDDEADDVDDNEDEDDDRELRQDEKEIMDRALAALDHISKSGGAKFNFEQERFLKSHLLQWDRKKDQSGKYRTDLTFASAKESVGGGRTQTGKTALKAALAILAKLCGVTVVVVTTTTGNRDSICDDLNSERYFGRLTGKFDPTGQFEACRPLCTTICKRRGGHLAKSERHNKFLDKCITQNGVIVANLSKGSVNKVRTKIQEVRGSNVAVGFALVKDEGESVISTSLHPLI